MQRVSDYLEDEEAYLRRRYHPRQLKEFRHTIRNIPGLQDQDYSWTEGDFKERRTGYKIVEKGFLFSKRKRVGTVICPAPKFDPRDSKQEQYTVGFLKKHLPPELIEELLAPEAVREVDDESQRVHIDTDKALMSAKKIDRILEQEVEGSITPPLKGSFHAKEEQDLCNGLENYTVKAGN